MAEPRFAIMIPHYGPRELLQKAVTSVLKQKQQTDWSLTIVDDAFPDITVGRWVESLNDQRVRYLRNETNLGLAKNFQRALDLSTGEYTTLLGSDDRLLPNYVGSLNSLTAAFPTAAIVQPGVRVINDDDRQIHPLPDIVKTIIRPRLWGRPARRLQGQPLAASLLRGDWAYFPSIAWRTDAARRFGFAPDMNTALDLRLLLNLIDAGETMVLGGDISFEYRRHRDSVSSELARNGRRFQEEGDLFQEFARRFAERGWHRAARAARWHVTTRAYQALSALK